MVEVTRFVALEFAKSTEDPFNQLTTLRVARIVFQRGQDLYVSGFDEIGDEHACHADRHPHARGDLRDGG